jgi:hypothetical protein
VVASLSTSVDEEEGTSIFEISLITMYVLIDEDVGN